MRRINSLLALGLLLTGCGGSGGGGSPPPPDEPTIYYVRFSGSDENDGETPETAFRNISHPTSRVMKPGDTVVVGPGVYRAQPPPDGPSGTSVDFTNLEGTAAAPLRLIADPTGEMTGDDPGDVVIDANDRPVGIRISRSPYVTIDGFVIREAKGTDASVGILARIKSTNVTIRNCVIRGNVNGIRVQDSDDAVIVNNLIADNETAGLFIANGSKRARVLNNTIANNGTRGIRVGGDANAEGEGSTGAVVRNNIIQNNSNVNVRVDDGPPDSLAGYAGNFNLVFTADVADQLKTYRPESVVGPDDVNADAVLIDDAAGDYHLDQTASPAIDGGSAATDGALLSELFSLSTSPDGAPDEPPLDIGYHYPAAPEEPAP